MRVVFGVLKKYHHLKHFLFGLDGHVSFVAFKLRERKKEILPFNAFFPFTFYRSTEPTIYATKAVFLVPERMSGSTTHGEHTI